MGVGSTHTAHAVDKNAVRNNIENNKVPFSVDANGRHPIKDGIVEEDRRFLFLNKQIVGNSDATKYASTALENLLTGGSVAAGAAKATLAIKRIIKSFSQSFTRSGRRLGTGIKNGVKPLGVRSGGVRGEKTSYKFTDDSVPLRLKGGALPPEERPLLGQDARCRLFPERPTMAR